ncbi:ABC transporter permease [Asanoa sp. WMMD1127]|uniref:ABC transporter permease n=1 Tax=Asanoa sp. WMMD1127 TaxID=3016107 RepID=UPI002415F8BF|nr:ABC transporter permease [Asanoa sp. WMMD1127]MDG4825280.1 ABC transporter permease [Asanoa sp. WMMD1127]
MTIRRRRAKLPRTPLERTLGWAFRILVWAVFAFLVVPIAIVVAESFNGVAYLSFPLEGVSLKFYRAFFSDSSWVHATVTSARIALMAAILATLIGSMAAWALARSKMRGRGLIFALMLSPMIVPLIVLAMSYYFFFAKLQLIGNEFAIAAAYAVMGIPMVLVAVSGALQHFDPELENAARTLGAGPVRTLWKITLPRLASAIGAGAIFAFVAAFDEAVVILFVAGSDAITLPRKLWDSVRYDLDPTLAVAGTVLIVVSVGLFLLVEVAGSVRARRRRRALAADGEPALGRSGKDLS